LLFPNLINPDNPERASDPLVKFNCPEHSWIEQNTNGIQNRPIHFCLVLRLSFVFCVRELF
ncbi:hypothetical protein T12_13502, partial [Trichinella patagoniensis]